MNIGVIDDLAADRDRIVLFLRTYFSGPADLPLSFQLFESGEEFMESFTGSYYDFIFIDYYMKGMSGLETAKRIREKDCSSILIFMTVSRDYAVDCYKVKASGYLVKPFSYEEFSEILSVADLEKIRDMQFIAITNGTKQTKILLKDILYCDISGHYIQIHLYSYGILRARMSFSVLAGMLSPYPEFLQCYRGCIVNMNQVSRLEDMSFLLKSGERIPFQKRERTKIIDTYSDFLFEKVRESKG